MDRRVELRPRQALRLQEPREPRLELIAGDAGSDREVVEDGPEVRRTAAPGVALEEVGQGEGVAEAPHLRLADHLLEVVSIQH